MFRFETSAISDLRAKPVAIELAIDGYDDHIAAVHTARALGLTAQRILTVEHGDWGHSGTEPCRS